MRIRRPSRPRLEGDLVLEIAAFLLSTLLISLSGVMAPGPVTAATLAAGSRTRHAGARIALGHGVVEFPLMLLIMAGMNRVFEIKGVQIGIGLMGGIMLILMGGQVFKDLARKNDSTARYADRSPVWIGILLTGGNPYFLLWWATVGMALAVRAWQLGAVAFAMFAMVHWLCDLIWLESLSQASYRGTRWMGERTQKMIGLICGSALVVFGLSFLWDSGRALLTH
ncbi:MAG: LysE family transporter [Phycisphaerales bacterium]|nr:LysE family transporter [Phycisphaerales bacterium]